MASRSTNSSLIIEDATPDDAGTIIDLIKELAIYENMLDQVKLTAAELKADLSDKQPWGLKAKVAKLLGTTGERETVGYALYFFRFDDLQGKRTVYMEDLYVRPAVRRIGSYICIHCGKQR